MYHFIDATDMTWPEWDELYSLCSDIVERPEDYRDACRGKIMGSLFSEPSTRTNFSFTAAMQRLGGSVLGFSDPGSTSFAKGESLKDTIIMVSGYTDVIVMRSPVEGAALAASLYSSVPVINAGDGGHLHPTQTLTDLTTIQRLHGELDNICIGLCGDLKNGRTVHTLIRSLCRRKNIQFFLISPRELAAPDYIIAELEAAGHKYYEISGLESVIPMLDVLYMTRIQRERFADPFEYERFKNVYVLDAQKMKRAKRDMLVMHPLPRVDEIAQDVDDDPRAAYFRQAKLGMYARMALLLTLTSKKEHHERMSYPGETAVCANPRCITAKETYLPSLDKKLGDTIACGYCEKAKQPV